MDPLHRKPKHEPVEVEVSVQPKGSSANSYSPKQKSPAAVVASKPLSAGKAESHSSKLVVLYHIMLLHVSVQFILSANVIYP